jgi:folate-dependent phosphoribosylglycinamide formyltransferase PurN
MHLFAHFSRFCAVIGGIMGKNIAVLASGSGTNAENIIRYFREKGSARVALVLTNRQNAFVLERANGQFGRMITLKGNEIASAPLEEIAGKLKLVTEDNDLVVQGRRMGICFG